ELLAAQALVGVRRAGRGNLSSRWFALLAVRFLRRRPVPLHGQHRADHAHRLSDHLARRFFPALTRRYGPLRPVFLGCRTRPRALRAATVGGRRRWSLEILRGGRALREVREEVVTDCKLGSTCLT